MNRGVLPKIRVSVVLFWWDLVRGRGISRNCIKKKNKVDSLQKEEEEMIDQIL